MYWFVLVCGWGLTAVVIALMWSNSQPGRNLTAGLLVGVVGGLLWPITLWLAIGAHLYRSAGKRAGTAAANPETLQTQAREAEAFAKQAELDGMPSSADYWRAEVQRLDAQRSGAVMATRRPASTPLIMLGCTVASLATIGAIALTAPSSRNSGPASDQADLRPTQVQATNGPIPTTSTRASATTLPSATTTALATGTPTPTPSQATVPSRRERVAAELIGRWRGTAVVNSSEKYIADVTVDQADLGESVGQLNVERPESTCSYTTSLIDASSSYIEFSLTLIETSESTSCGDESGTARLEIVNGVDDVRVQYFFNGSKRGLLDRYAR